MMKRDECFRALARHVTDEVVVATYSSAVDWLALGERALNYFSVGAMGLDSSHALGLALGRPDKRIICLQGDGSLLMNLGCLVTIAAAAPKNLVHMVVQNGTYEANGSHPIPNTKVEFAAMARSAGYAHVHEFRNWPISSSRPRTSSGRTARCSQRFMWSDRSRSLTTMQTSTIRHGASRSRRRCGQGSGAPDFASLIRATSWLPVNNRGKYRPERRSPRIYGLCSRSLRQITGR